MSGADPAPPGQVAVIGAGWAGCAAALELATCGHRVTVFEAARTLGGRARQVLIDGKQIDNGQHILLGAYRETLRLMRIAGIDANRTLLRLPLQMRYPASSAGMDFVAARLPAPLHLLAGLYRARGLRWEDKLALLRFSSAARWMAWQLNQDCSVTELLDRFDQTERLTKLMWRPLCIAALNTPPERASAQVFLSVLRDSLGSVRSASDMLIPRPDLTSLFPQRAAAFVEQHGGTVLLGAGVQSLERTGEQWMVKTADSRLDVQQRFDAVIVAMPPAQAACLLEAYTDTVEMKAFRHESITTCYLQYSNMLRLPAPFFALMDDEPRRHWGQFVFDRGQIDTSQSGMLAVVVSASTAAIEEGQDALASDIAQQLAQEFQMPQLANPLWVKVITEKRATFSCTPGLSRPGNTTAVDTLAIAGDYTKSDYPATLESATRSGVAAAGIIQRTLAGKKAVRANA